MRVVVFIALALLLAFSGAQQTPQIPSLPQAFETDFSFSIDWFNVRLACFLDLVLKSPAKFLSSWLMK